MGQTQSTISDERLAEIVGAGKLWCGDPGMQTMARELIQARSDLADVEDLLPAPAGPYQTMGERTKLLKDQGEYAQEMCGRAVKLLEAARDEFTALRASHKRLVEAMSWALDLLDMYDKKLVEMGEPKEMVYAAVHLTGKAKARAALADARKLEGR